MTYEQIKPYIAEGLINEQVHPEYPDVRLFNYTQKCQFEKKWDEVTKVCRGLILNVKTGEIVARPFPKFFNYEEHVANGDTLPNEVPEVYPKYDGSLGIMYWIEDKPYFATRGSFVSDQARWVMEHMLPFGKDSLFLDKSLTHLFEIIYPENRVVVSYGWSGIIYLGSIDRETGETKNFPQLNAIPFTSYEQLKALNTPNEEGFVLFYPKANMRVKIKFEEYKRLHKVMTGLSSIGVWEMLRDGVDPLSHDIPDEMHPWLNDVINQLTMKYNAIENKAKEVHERVKDLPSRKEQAIAINELEKEHGNIVFLMLDEKDYSKPIWQKIRPVGSQTFVKDNDA